MTMADFEVLTKAHEYRQVDQMFLASFKAWQTSQAQATDRKGKPVHRKFSSLFDYEESLRRVRNGDRPERVIQDKTSAALVARANRKAGETRDE